MSNYSTTPAGWIDIQHAKANNRGKLMLYVSPALDTIVLACRIDNTESTTVYCFQCTKKIYPHCQLADTEALRDLLDDGDERAASSTKATKEKVIPTLASLLSVDRYPCI
jgi:hypothetical protein